MKYADWSAEHHLNNDWALLQAPFPSHVCNSGEDLMSVRHACA